VKYLNYVWVHLEAENEESWVKFDWKWKGFLLSLPAPRIIEKNRIP
jgi:hypothetical protein